MTAMHSIHHSRPHRYIPTPASMSRAQIGHEGVTFVEEQALGIFTELVNAGASFQECLAAIYLSGMDAGIYGMKDREAKCQTTKN